MIMEKIKYEMNSAFCKTKCPNRSLEWVASNWCQKNCHDFVNINEAEKYVLCNYIKNNNMKKIEINVPNGYEAVKTEKGYDIVPIKVENPPSIKLEECMEKIQHYNKTKKHYYYIDECGKIEEESVAINYNHAPENTIRAEQIQMVWRRLAIMYNEGIERPESRYYIYLNENTIETGNAPYVFDESVVFYNENDIKKAIKEIGEENLIFMLKNL